MVTPYYQDEWVTIYHGDCRKILPELPKVDLVLTDPPYGINYEGGNLAKWNVRKSRAPFKNSGGIVGDDGELDTGFLFDYPRRLIWGFPYLYDGEASGWLVWVKHEAHSVKVIGTPVEMASTTLWKSFRLIKCLWTGYLRENGEYRFAHPTQKPQKVFDYALTNYTQPDDLILDPFLGSGTTCYCAKKLNRHSIGIEIEEKYCEIAAKRCSQSVMELNI